MDGRTARLLAAGVAFSFFSFAPPVGAQDSPPARQPRVRPAPVQPVEEVPDEEVDDAKARPAAPPVPGLPATPGANQPAAAQPPAPKGSPPSVRVPGPYIVREKPKDWTLTVNVTVRPDRSYPGNATLKNQLPVTGNFQFDTMSMVFPLPSETSSALPDASSLQGKLLVNDQPAVDSKGAPIFPVLLDKQISGELYHSGTRLMRFGLDKPTACREIGMEFAIGYRCWNTILDEESAMRVDWPTGEIPALAGSTLGPQIFVDYARTRGDGGTITAEYDRRPLVDMVNSYTNGNPRGARPLAAAKYIAGRIAQDFQTSGDGLVYINTTELQGFNLQGVPVTIQNRRGSEFDINSLVVSAFRAAGLPARLVVGYDLGQENERASDFLGTGKSRDKKLRSWAEFGLYDEKARTLTWIPVDVVRMRKASSRMGAIDRPWKYFGTNDELNRVVPLAFGFHPPTTVESYGAPGLWGWLMTPQPPDTAYQAIRFRATSTSKTAEDMQDEQKKKKKDKGRGY